MLGQQNLIKKLRETKARSVLISGRAHWGKKTLLRELFAKEESVYEITGNAATFRETLERIYLNARPTVYLIPDIDRCNATIQNLLLKMLEEPPLASRFYLTASGSVLPTITSRCVTYRMEPYSDPVLGNLNVQPCLIGLCKSPGEFKLLDTPNIQIVGETLKDINTSLQTMPLSKVLLMTRDLDRMITEDSLPQEAFILLATAVFGKSDSLDWLRQQPLDGVRYVRKVFFMKLWVERQVM